MKSAQKSKKIGRIRAGRRRLVNILSEEGTKTKRRKYTKSRCNNLKHHVIKNRRLRSVHRKVGYILGII